jgi:capsule biosynthesis phosphatase
MDHFKRIVVDIDDTISFTTNRDWENATPNVELINKLNKLYDEGWEINFVTARGSLSCKSREEAEEKFAPGIKAWFEKHGVKYHSLSFNKILAAYYIDDKGITPEDFTNLDIKILKGGMSGAFIEKRNDKVYKNAENSIDAAAWYRTASKYFNTPKIHSLIGNTLCMEYIEKDSDVCIFDVISIINRMKCIPTTANPFSTYIKRVEDHLKVIPIDKTKKKFIIRMMKNQESDFDSYSSFSHGDFSIDNLIAKNGKVYMIDPIHIDGLYSSWILDVGKLLHSLRRYNMMEEHKIISRMYEDYMPYLSIVELTQWIRIYKYSSDELKVRVVEEIEKLIEVL